MSNSGDGVLAAFHLGQRKLIEKSDNQESELLCVSIIKVNLCCNLYYNADILKTGRSAANSNMYHSYTFIDNCFNSRVDVKLFVEREMALLIFTRGINGGI